MVRGSMERTLLQLMRRMSRDMAVAVAEGARVFIASRSSPARRCLGFGSARQAPTAYHLYVRFEVEPFVRSIERRRIQLKYRTPNFGVKLAAGRLPRPAAEPPRSSGSWPAARRPTCSCAAVAPQRRSHAGPRCSLHQGTLGARTGSPRGVVQSAQRPVASESRHR
jgi:hypothetical protein